ncbi:unnamed protein product [Cylicostephanus goldi]|uniref:Myosin tail domain-containing protein n=1 Tax=Cylicostephanus goldi TaxID=71465 RepID=A0A3P7NNW1_CYLGO|nr:unnamed protein product [Cylicostephanus goldi]
MLSLIRYGLDATPFSSPASADWTSESPVWSAQWGSLSPGSQYSSVSEMEEKLRMRATIDERAGSIRALEESVRAVEGTVSTLQEEVSHRAESKARTEGLLKQSLHKQYEMTLKHEDDLEEAEARLKPRDDIIVSQKGKYN